jgi:predicted nucleic acid-binding protein
VIYFDTSFIAPLLRSEPTSEAVERFLAGIRAGEAAISRWTQLEFSSLLARDVRMGSLPADDADRIQREFDRDLAESFLMLMPSEADFDLARQYVQRYDSGLRSGDALHLAIGANNGAEIFYSLDRGLLRAAESLGLPASSGIRLPPRGRR